MHDKDETNDGPEASATHGVACNSIIDAPPELQNHLDHQRTLVESYLAEALQSAGECPASLMEAMRYSLLAPGKRLRPLLVLLAAEAAGGTCEQGMPAACAVEMVHTYSLIHDDLPAMDDDDLRRGRPTCHKQFGEALAILAGDALLTMSFGILAESCPPATASACCRELALGAGAAGMVGGQVEDLAWENQPGSLADLEKIHANKTGALFRACLRMGFWSAQAESIQRDMDILHNLDGFGRCFGQLFQITDDLLDVEGDAHQTGKGVKKDAARGKLTYPAFMGPEKSRQLARELSGQAVQHLQPLGPAGNRLAAMVQWVESRDR